VRRKETNDLAGDVRAFGREEVDEVGDVLRTSRATQWDALQVFLALRLRIIRRPLDDTGRDAIDGDLGREFARKPKGEIRQRRFARAVDQILRPRSLGEQVDHVDDMPATGAQHRFKQLADQQWRLHVNGRDLPHELHVGVAQSRGLVDRGAVDEEVESLMSRTEHVKNSPRRNFGVLQIGFDRDCTEFFRKQLGFSSTSMKGERDDKSFGRKLFHDGAADAFRPACHQRNSPIICHDTLRISGIPV
jgi:hypothetical protein